MPSSKCASLALAQKLGKCLIRNRQLLLHALWGEQWDPARPWMRAKSQGTSSIHLFFQSFLCVWIGPTDVTSKLDKGAKIIIGCQSGGTVKPTPNLADGQQSRLALIFEYSWKSLHRMGLSTYLVHRNQEYITGDWGASIPMLSVGTWKGVSWKFFDYEYGARE